MRWISPPRARCGTGVASGGGEHGGGATEKTSGSVESAAREGKGDLDGDFAEWRPATECRFWNGDDRRDVGVIARLCEETGVVMTGDGASGETVESWRWALCSMDDDPATGVTGSISLRGSTGLDSGVMKEAEEDVCRSSLQQG